MPITRTLLAAGLLLLSAAAFAPTAAADDFLDARVFGTHVTACAILVYGSCDPYDGHLVRVTVDDRTLIVPDPCYTTMCF